MSIARTWVFPIIRLVIFAVIALALAKIAFFSGATDSPTNPDVPYAEIVEPQVAVAIGTIRNDVTMDALVTPKPAVAVPASLTGEVKRVFVAAGDSVKKGDALVQLSSELPVESDDPEDVGKTYTKWATVVAPAAGTLSSFTALTGQSFSIGDPVGQIAPPSFVVTGTLAPDQLYKLIDEPETAEVQITGGPAPFTCKHLTISTPLAGATTEGEATGTTVTCSVPKKMKVFSGLAAKLTIAGGLAENVLTVPTTAVEGSAETGNVYVLDAAGTPTPKAVKLGLNDGKLVEITDGLAKGDSVLEFVPGAECDPAVQVCEEQG
jgi:multidrug efflux pump subunit AcrA (membrane-fusion protein)